MWSLRKPTESRLEAFLAGQERESFSYADVGHSHEGSPAGYDLDHNRIELGIGPAVFEAACKAFSAWRMFPRPWTGVWPPDAPIAVGTNVVMFAHCLGLWWINACRIVYTIDDAGPIRRRRHGFAYGTLPGHVEQGEERFSVEWDEDDRVWYDLRAFSRPRQWFVRLGYPIARRLQRRFVRDSQAAMRAAVAAP